MKGYRNKLLIIACVCHIGEFILTVLYWNLITGISPIIPGFAIAMAIAKSLFGLNRLVFKIDNTEKVRLYIFYAIAHIVLSIFTIMLFYGLLWLTVAHNLSLTAIILVALIGSVNIVGLILIVAAWIDFYLEIPDTSSDIVEGDP